LYEQYQVLHAKQLVASYATFRRVFGEWKKKLKFRTVGQHARCADCARFTKMRQVAKDSAAAQQAKRSKQEWAGQAA
jgi:hypothetical protein